MPSDFQHATLQAALIAGGYDEKAAKVAAVAGRRGLGAETTVNLISGIDGAAAQIAEKIFADQGQQAPPAAQMSQEQAYAAGIQELDKQLREAVGFGPPAGGDE